MNSYKISYSLFNKDKVKEHFSNCRSTIQGETFEDAVEKFKQQKLKEGWLVGFLLEGDMFNVEFFDLKTGEKIKEVNK